MEDHQYVHGASAEEQERLTRFNELTNKDFLDFLDLNGARRILEVGSGLAILAGQVARQAPEAEVFGIERSPEQLAAVGHIPANLHLLQADAHTLPFEDKFFDVVYARYVLEHLHDPLRALTEVKRVLRPGGKFYSQENNILECIFYPEIPRFEAMWKNLAVVQAKLGGDALLGKKLYWLLYHAGFSDIELSMGPEIHHHGTPAFVPWIENLITILQGAEENFIRFGLARNGDLAAAIEEARALESHPDAAAYFYWNRAIGAKNDVSGNHH